MTMTEIMKRIAERFAEAFLRIILLPFQALGLVAASAVDGWRAARASPEQQHAQADDADDEAAALLAAAEKLEAAKALAARRRVCGARQDPEGGAPAAPAPAPTCRTLGRVPAARTGHRLMLLELPEDDEAEELGLDAVLPVLR